MKNFTNNFKQLTSRLSARWLIMALMLLLGTSSAWGANLASGQVIQFKFSQGSVSKESGWNGTILNMWDNNNSEQVNVQPGEVYTISEGHWIPTKFQYLSQYDWGGWKGQTAEIGDCDGGSTLLTNKMYEVTLSTSTDWTGTQSQNYPNKQFKHTLSCEDADLCKPTYYIAGTLPDASWDEGEHLEMTTCDRGLRSLTFNGVAEGDYEFKITQGNWGWSTGSYYTDKGNLTCESSGGNIKISTIGLGQTNITIYFDGTKAYASYTAACTAPQASDFTYTLPDDDNTQTGNEVMWDGNTHAAIVTWAGENSTEGITIYYTKTGGSKTQTAPSDAGTYTVTIETTAQGDFCPTESPITLGSFTITCPTPADSPIYSVTQRTTSCDETDNKLGIITLNNYDPAYAYQLNGKAVTVTNNQITDLAAGSYIVSAAKTCGSAQSDPKSGSSVTITSTDLTPTIAKKIEISGDNNICSGETTELTCNVEASKGTIDSYSWNQAGTQNGNTLTTAILNATTNYVATVTITNDGCPKDFSSEPYIVTVNPVPSFTTRPSSVTLCSSSTPISVAELIAETKATASNSATIKLYDGNGVEITSPININTQTTTTTTYKLKASTQTCSSDFVSFSLTVNYLPAAPSLISPDPVCEDATVQLPTEGLKWYDAETGGTEVQNTAIKVTGTYWAAAVQNGCESATRTRYDVTVNPKPTISISGKGTAVLYEDVTLTAEATDGAEVKWYLGDDVNPVATGTTYTITSETAGEVTVKAKAFLGDCESNFKEYPVTFDEENCQGSLSNDIIINFTHPNKDESNKNCQYWGFGTLDYKINGTSQSTIDLGKETTGTKTITIENIVASKITDVKFTAYYTFNSCNCEAYTKTIELEKGYEYDVTIEEGGGSGQQSSGSAEKTLVIERSVSLSTPAPLSAPAVKTVSATSEEGSGVVNFTGQIIKTGCAANSKIYYGYQYRLETEDWPTTGVQAGNDKLQLKSLTNASETALHYEFSSGDITLDNGKYVFRAYIINGYNFTNGNYDQGVYYGIDIPVTVSTQKRPIENLQVQYADDKGGVLQDQNVTYCVGDDAYIKLIYDGSKLKPEEDEINISSTLENTFTLVDGIADLYTFVVKGNETITVNAKNKENTDNPTAELTINTYAVPVIPSIDIDKTTICSNDATGAKITVSNPQVGITYQVYKILGESEPTTHGEPKKYSEGVLEFNSMKEAGTYYVRAYNNEQCPNTIAQSLDEILTVIDADATSISISPETKTVNPWVPVTFTVSKEGNYDYTFSCKEDENDVTSNMVINKSGDTYVVKFPKPDGVSAATDLNGQVTFADKTYYVEVKLNADVQCGTFNDESVVTLKPVNEICN